MKTIKIYFIAIIVFIFIFSPLSLFLNPKDNDIMIIGGFRSTTSEIQDDNHIVVNANFAQSYYSNLNIGYFGYNNIDICGYVAIGMLLSYYDNYWNDELIPDEYDKIVEIDSTNIEDYNNSPGTDEIYFSASQWSEYLMNDNNNRFVPNLVKIGYNLGYYEINNNSISFSHTSFNMINSVLQNYLNNHQSLNSYAFSLTCVNYEYNYNDLAENSSLTNGEKIRNDIIAYVKNGIPVLVGLSGATPEDAGHIVIAYDYDQTQNIIYGHFGWFNNNKKHFNIEAESFNNISAYIMLTPRCNHSHSDNIKTREDRICSCALSNHFHEYVEYQTIVNNDKNHIAKCYCGTSKNEPHNFMVIGDNYVCKNCRFSKKYDGKLFPIIIASVEKDLLSIANKNEEI